MKEFRNFGKEVAATDFEKLYQTYYMQVYSYAMTLVRNPFLAEEITQQTFFQALSKKDSYRGRSGEFTWLCAIAKNLAADIYRKASRQGELPEEEAVSESDIQKDAEDREMSLQIHTVLHDLREPYKEVFQLRIFGELSFSDIGRIFHKSENWGRVTYHRARLMIRERMGL